MDDKSKYGPEFHRLKFTDAVENRILSDFRVKIAIVPADKVDKEFQQSIGGKEKSMPLDERTMLAAVWHGINHPDDNDKKPRPPLQRLIAFANRIDRSMMFAGKIKDEGGTDRSFANVVSEYEKWNPTGNRVEVRHIDGKTNAVNRRDGMNWLDESTDDPKMCRILSNARCLTEGVDVPALDGVVFLNPRKSRVDVVQSVGRVMRKSKDKKYGYVILPVAIPAGLEYHEALNDNRTFKVVWQVLNALRSHDEDFGREIDRLVLDQNPEVTGTPRVSVSVLDEAIDGEPLTKLFSSIKTKLVEKVGDINYYDKYGQELGETARKVETMIRNRMKTNSNIVKEIENLHTDLKSMINDSITLDSTIHVVAQHVILSRIFDLMFSGGFTSHNPISSVLNKITEKIGLEEELQELAGFYEEARRELKAITTREARQGFIKKIYGNFFESADKKSAERHGVVYTPVEIIDFIIHSVEDLLKRNFGVCLNDRPVKVIDPFAGTGTFITRLLESGLITNNLYEKYKNDLFADELILLAYYVATVNIETTYSSLRQGNKHVRFDGISYTDTLKINPRYRMGAEHRQEQKKLDSQFRVAHERIRKQRGSHVHVIIGNPPYSAGQSDYNDENPNVSYPDIDTRIESTYIERVKQLDKNIHLTRSLYDSYIRSLRWASDRIGTSGVVGFVTNASFLRSDTAAGVRACLAEEFNEIWCFDLRGKKGMDGDGRNIFEYAGKSTGGTTVSTVILLLVKNPVKQTRVIKYAKLESKYYSGQNKRDRVKELKSVSGINNWKFIKPDKHHDWLEQRGGEFEQYAPIGDKSTKFNGTVSSVRSPPPQREKIKASCIQTIF